MPALRSRPGLSMGLYLISMPAAISEPERLWLTRVCRAYHAAVAGPVRSGCADVARSRQAQAAAGGWLACSRPFWPQRGMVAAASSAGELTDPLFGHWSEHERLSGRPCQLCQPIPRQPGPAPSSGRSLPSNRLAGAGITLT